MNMMRWFRKVQPLIGLDMDFTAVRLIELIYKDGEYRVNACAKASIERAESCIEERAIIAAVKQAVNRAKPRATKIATAVSHAEVIFKQVQLDASLSEEEIASQVLNQADRYFNYPIQDLMLDFEILGRAKNHPGLVEIRWVAARRRQVESIVNVLTQAGLTPTVMDVDSFALQRATHLLIKQMAMVEQSVAIVQLNAQSFLLSIFEQNIPIYVRTENYPETASAEIITSLLIRSLQLCSSPNKVALILLAGEKAKMANLKEQIRIQTHILTQIADPFTFLAAQNKPDSAISHEFMISMGLAMRIH